MIYFIKLYYVLGFLVYYLYKLLASNLLITHEILTPKDHTKPGFIEIPVSIKKPVGILLFSNLLSMTPGTLCISLTDDNKVLLLHVLFSQNETEIRKEVAYIQERIQKITD